MKFKLFYGEDERRFHQPCRHVIKHGSVTGKYLKVGELSMPVEFILVRHIDNIYRKELDEWRLFNHWPKHLCWKPVQCGAVFEIT